MIRYEIVNSRLPEIRLRDTDLVVREIEAVIAECKLDITLKSTLSTMKGSIHYHLKKGREAGVLEVTYWPQKSRMFVEIHRNRLAEWNNTAIVPFSEALAHRLSGVAQLDAD